MTLCPVCGYKLDDATCLSDEESSKPKKGDFSLCGSCGEILVFNQDLTVSQANLNDLVDVPPGVMEGIGRVQKVIRKERITERKQP